MIDSIKTILELFRGPISYHEKIEKYQGLYNSRILYSQSGNDALYKHVTCDEPFFISRLGGTELRSITHFLQKRFDKLHKKSYTKKIRQAIWQGPGYFPTDNESIDAFCDLYTESIREVTALGVWFNHNEWNVSKEFCPNAILVDLGCLEPYLHTNPYTSMLKGKNVLVIHPFVASIEKQYNQNRGNLFHDPNVLPRFNLSLIKPPQTIAGNTDGYNSWMAAFDDLRNKVDASSFDIAIVGAGGYGLPLGAHIKRKGKSVIHLGGVTQILFGIKGKRWETEYNYAERIFNKNWVYPLEEEKPANFTTVENGCYW